MGIVLKFIILIAAIVLGISMMRYNYQLTQLFGHNYHAERYLGQGGTYTMWRLSGLAVIIGSIIYFLA